MHHSMIKNTISTNLRLLHSNLNGRTRIFEDACGIQFDNRLSQINEELVNPITLAVSNFIMINTDATVELVLTQLDNLDRFDAKLNTVVLKVTGFFLTYSKIQKLEIRRVENSIRVPKISVIYG